MQTRSQSEAVWVRSPIIFLRNTVQPMTPLEQDLGMFPLYFPSTVLTEKYAIHLSYTYPKIKSTAFKKTEKSDVLVFTKRIDGEGL